MILRYVAQEHERPQDYEGRKTLIKEMTEEMQ
jgi:hypothetical protein